MLAQIDQMHLMSSFLQVVHECILHTVTRFARDLVNLVNFLNAHMFIYFIVIYFLHVSHLTHFFIKIYIFGDVEF